MLSIDSSAFTVRAMLDGCSASSLSAMLAQQSLYFGLVCMAWRRSCDDGDVSRAVFLREAPWNPSYGLDDYYSPCAALHHSPWQPCM
eukprot:scaffold621436_cov45-Prasinocladus_malaysianus.AAC.1